MSIHVYKCSEEWHLRYPGMTEAEAQSMADKINAGALYDAEKLEPLRAQVAMLRNLLNKFEYNEFGVKRYPREEDVDAALTNTRATAKQFVTECERRGAVNALEELLPEIHKARDTGSVWGKAKEKIAQLSATSKKAE